MKSWYISLYNSELYNGSLLLAEHFYKLSKCPTAFKYLILNLYQLGYYSKILSILEDISLDDYHIRLIYYKSIIKTNTNPKNQLPKIPSYEILSLENILNFKSVEIFWESLTKKDILKKDLLIKAYKTDTRNIESLYYLIKDEMLTQKEVSSLLDLNEQRDILYQIFLNYENFDFNFATSFFHPIYAFLFSKNLFIEKNKFDLFNISHTSYKLYDKCVFTHLSLSLYFLLIEDFEESKKVLLKCLDFDKQTGQIYLYLGICYSKLRECEKSLSCFNICNKKMICTWKSFYYISFEYQKMTNFDKSRFYYLEGLAVERNIIIQEGYVSLLIFLEDYKEALSYISGILRSKENYKSNNVLLLKCYCHLFLGNIKESREALEKCEKDYKYYCTKGYIEHLTNNIDKACDLYNKSLMIRNNTVVEELMSTASRLNKENEVYNSCTEIFEYLFITSQEIKVI
ncbi:enolase [Vairimorpha necatrix]|uniref:Enolase n=1 Tax=Vairimorpha necatrix TaxID=6039 RepID=A0AAX4JBX0_9MICR